jgi:uncharacterized protein
MFRVNLSELDRKGSLRLQHRFPEDDPLWEGSGYVFRTPLEVEVDVTATGTDQVVVRGTMRAVLGQTCRRCLAPVDTPVERSLEMVWSPPDGFPDGLEGEDSDMRTMVSGARELDLAEPVREEFLLEAPRFVSCREDCLGLCPGCGANLNEIECNCSSKEPDPRWDALRREHR